MGWSEAIVSDTADLKAGAEKRAEYAHSPKGGGPHLNWPCVPSGTIETGAGAGGTMYYGV